MIFFRPAAALAAETSRLASTALARALWSFPALPLSPNSPEVVGKTSQSTYMASLVLPAVHSSALPCPRRFRAATVGQWEAIDPDFPTGERRGWSNEDWQLLGGLGLDRQERAIPLLTSLSVGGEGSSTRRGLRDRWRGSRRPRWPCLVSSPVVSFPLTAPPPVRLSLRLSRGAVLFQEAPESTVGVGRAQGPRASKAQSIEWFGECRHEGTRPTRD